MPVLLGCRRALRAGGSGGGMARDSQQVRSSPSLALESPAVGGKSAIAKEYAVHNLNEWEVIVEKLQSSDQ